MSGALLSRYDEALLLTAVEGAWAAAREAGLSAITTEQILSRLPVVEGRRAVGLTAGPCPAERHPTMGAVLQSFRQSSFPIELVRKAFGIRVQVRGLLMSSLPPAFCRQPPPPHASTPHATTP